MELPTEKMMCKELKTCLISSKCLDSESKLLSHRLSIKNGRNGFGRSEGILKKCSILLFATLLVIGHFPAYSCAYLNYNNNFGMNDAEELNNMDRRARFSRDFQKYMVGSNAYNPKPYQLENSEDYDDKYIDIMRGVHQMERRFGSKKSLDLGLQRDYSGNAAAKHLIGLAVAENAVGPGKR